MGLSIHYSGHISDNSLIDDLIKEVEDISKSLDWSYTIIHDDKLKGICCNPEGSEPVWFTFDLSGRLCSPASLMRKELNDPFFFINFTKTQYAGPDAHITIIKLIRYIEKKYFSSFELCDEGMYWETMNENILRNQFAKYGFTLQAVATALSNMKRITGETPESLAEKIEDELKKRMNPGSPWHIKQNIQRRKAFFCRMSDCRGILKSSLFVNFYLFLQ